MDTAKLRLYLNDEYTYEDATKEIFLNEVEEDFKAYKNSGDTALTWSVVQTRIRKPYFNFDRDHSESQKLDPNLRELFLNHKTLRQIFKFYGVPFFSTS